MRLQLVSVLVAAVAIVGCKHGVRNNLPPAQMLMEPGPGVGGPGPGVMTPLAGPAACAPATSQVAFVGPEGAVVHWDVAMAGMFDSEPLVCPGRYNFPQGAIYRLKLTNLPGRPGVELYPTLEVGPVMPRTEAFLAHNPIPVQFTEEDLDQVLTNNFVTKVIYLPDAEYQQLALAGVETLVSTRLDPGVDPIVEADRLGAILAVVRIGNIDLQIPQFPGGMPGDQIPEGGIIQTGYAQGGSAMPIAYSAGTLGMPGCPCEGGYGAAGGAGLPGPVSGLNAPQYGMPYCGTPIGLPGPPHVPLGIPAGLQQHRIVNHTKVHVPGPTENVRIDVKQRPGMSYPKPANHVRIVERTRKGLGVFTQPHCDKHEVIQPGCAACEAACVVE